jgi:hypothetical protein
MKRILLYFTLLTVVFLACDPIEDRDSLSGVVSEGELKLSATPIVVDGRNSNEIVVENNSPILSRWISDRSQVESAYTTVVFDYTGNRDVKFVGLNGDGSRVESTLPVTIDTMTNLSSDIVSRMGIKYNDDGTTVDKTSKPYFIGNANYVEGVDYEISVKQEMDGDVKGNKLILNCEAPYLCNWTFGTANAEKNKCEVFVTSTGTYTLSLDYTKADGTVIEDYLTQEIEVEKLTYVPQVLMDLFGDFVSNPDTSKTWQWARSGKVWANGPVKGFTDPGAGWWQNEYADMQGRQDGTMTFDFSDLSLTKKVTASSGETNIEPVGTYTGEVEVDLGTKTEGYSIGILKLFDGITILNGVNVNIDNTPFTELSIIKVTANTLILGGNSPEESWLYKFEYVKE